METVLSFHKLTIDKLSESSVQKLELKVKSLTCVIYEKWRKIGGHRDRLYEKFPNNMQDPFDWVPELVQEEKKENIEIEKPEKQKSYKTDVSLLLTSCSNELLTKQQIFDEMYSRKITPGQCRLCEYGNHVLETVLNLKDVTIDKLSECSVKKLKTKVNSFTQWLKTKWRTHGIHWINKKLQKKRSF